MQALNLARQLPFRLQTEGKLVGVYLQNQKLFCIPTEIVEKPSRLKVSDNGSRLDAGIFVNQEHYFDLCYYHSHDPLLIIQWHKKGYGQQRVTYPVLMRGFALLKMLVRLLNLPVLVCKSSAHPFSCFGIACYGISAVPVRPSFGLQVWISPDASLWILLDGLVLGVQRLEDPPLCAYKNRLVSHSGPSHWNDWILYREQDWIAGPHWGAFATPSLISAIGRALDHHYQTTVCSQFLNGDFKLKDLVEFPKTQLTIQ